MNMKCDAADTNTDGDMIPMCLPDTKNIVRLIARRSVHKVCDQVSLLSYKDKIGYRGSYIPAHVLLNLINELRKSIKMLSKPHILSLFLSSFIQLNKT